MKRRRVPRAAAASPRRCRARAADGLSRRCAGAARSRSRATTAAIPRSAPSGGTSPAGCATRAASRSASRSRSSATGRASPRTIPSAFAPRQLVFAHAAIADPAHGRLRHDQRAARAGFGLAGADEATDARWIDDWSLALDGERYVREIAAREFALDLAFARRSRSCCRDGGLLAQGAGGRQASYYYSRPQLAVTRTRRRRRPRARGRGARVARSRVVERGDGASAAGLGLDRHQPRRRRRADGVSHARPRGGRPVGRRRAARRRRPHRDPRAGRAALRPGRRGARRAPGSRIRWRSTSARAASTTRSRR